MIPGAIKIADGLKQLKQLKVANFGDCLTRTEGFKAILNSLEESGALNHLEELVLNGNEIKGLNAADHFISIVSKVDNKKLKVDLSANCFGESAVEKMLTEFKDKISLIIIDDEDEDEDDINDEQIEKLIKSPDTTVDDLCSEIVNLSINNFDQTEQKVHEKALKQSEELLEAVTSKATNSSNVANSLLVHMGLLKHENSGKYKQVDDLRGPFLTLKNLSPKLDKSQKDLLSTFIDLKKNKKVDQTGKIKTQLMQSLFI